MSQMNSVSEYVMQGLLDAFKRGAIYSPLPQAIFQEGNDHYLYAWGMDYCCGNGIIEKNMDRAPTEKQISDATQFFSSKNLPFMWWSKAKILEEKGFQFGGALTGICLDISKEVPKAGSMVSGLTIKKVETEAELSSFIDIAANAFAMTDMAAKQWLTLNSALIKKTEYVNFMAYLNGAAVGTVTLVVTPKTAGIWNLSTTEEHRKLGIGAALVQAALLEAKKRQAEQVMAILMPKGLAWGLFKKIGFKAVSELPFYIYGTRAEDLEK